MKELNEQIERLEETISIREKDLESFRSKLIRLKSKSEPTMNDLYADINKYVDISIKEGGYKKILGGDGRSQPWDEDKEGVIVTIDIKEEYYLTKKQVEVVKDYIRNTRDKFDHIRVSDI